MWNELPVKLKSNSLSLNAFKTLLFFSQTTRSVPIASSKLIWNFPNYFCNFEKPLRKSPEERCKSPYGICNVSKLIKCF